MTALDTLLQDGTTQAGQPTTPRMPAGGAREITAAVLADPRFERIARSAMRMTGLSMAFVATLEDDGGWLRAQCGLPVQQTGCALEFCDAVARHGAPLSLDDARTHPVLQDNPLVRGVARVRRFAGVPLLGEQGGVAGVLGVLGDADDATVAFSRDQLDALSELALLAQAELRVDALSARQRAAEQQLDQQERRARFDAVTGCLSERHLREQLALSVADAHIQGRTLALCFVRLPEFEALTGPDLRVQDAVRIQLVQQLRQRLPAHGALAALEGADFCALLPADDAVAAQSLLEAFCTPPVVRLGPPATARTVEVPIRFGCAALHELGLQADATDLWEHALTLTA